MAMEQDLEDYDIIRHPGYSQWDGDMNEWKQAGPPLEVPAFSIPPGDAGKIVKEVKDSCLSEKAKKAILAAVQAGQSKHKLA